MCVVGTNLQKKLFKQKKTIKILERKIYSNAKNTANFKNSDIKYISLW